MFSQVNVYRSSFGFDLSGKHCVWDNLLIYLTKIDKMLYILRNSIYSQKFRRINSMKPNQRRRNIVIERKVWKNKEKIDEIREIFHWCWSPWNGRIKTTGLHVWKLKFSLSTTIEVSNGNTILVCNVWNCFFLWPQYYEDNYWLLVLLK